MAKITKITAGVLALSILGTTAFATPQTPVVTDNEQQDLLTIASNGALTSESAGVYQLSSTEMDEVHGGKFRLKIKFGGSCVLSPICIVINK